jgi:hypothetical protein
MVDEIEGALPYLWPVGVDVLLVSLNIVWLVHILLKWRNVRADQGRRIRISQHGAKLSQEQSIGGSRVEYSVRAGQKRSNRLGTRQGHQMRLPLDHSGLSDVWFRIDPVGQGSLA